MPIPEVSSIHSGDTSDAGFKPKSRLMGLLDKQKPKKVVEEVKKPQFLKK